MHAGAGGPVILRGDLSRSGSRVAGAGRVGEVCVPQNLIRLVKRRGFAALGTRPRFLLPGIIASL